MGERNIFGRICCPRERRVNVLKFGESCELENFWKFKNSINLIELRGAQPLGFKIQICIYNG